MEHIKRPTLEDKKYLLQVLKANTSAYVLITEALMQQISLQESLQVCIEDIPESEGDSQAYSNAYREAFEWAKPHLNYFGIKEKPEE